jgi:hypothetical protein
MKGGSQEMQPSLFRSATSLSTLSAERHQIARDRTHQKYIPLFEKVTPGKKVALFFQIDRRLYALLDMQVSSEIPLIIQ